MPKKRCQHVDDGGMRCTAVARFCHWTDQDSDTVYVCHTHLGESLPDWTVCVERIPREEAK